MTTQKITLNFLIFKYHFFRKQESEVMRVILKKLSTSEGITLLFINVVLFRNEIPFIYLKGPNCYSFMSYLWIFLKLKYIFHSCNILCLFFIIAKLKCVTFFT